MVEIDAACRLMDRYFQYSWKGSRNVLRDNMLIEMRKGDGKVAWLNAYSEFHGFLTDDQLDRFWSATTEWGTAIARN